MKLIAWILTSLFLVANVAFAEVYVCRSGNDQELDYLIAMKKDSGILFNNKHGLFQAMEGALKVVRDEESRKNIITFSPVQEINWSMQPNKCEAFGEPIIKVEIPWDNNPDQESNIGSSKVAGTVSYMSVITKSAVIVRGANVGDECKGSAIDAPPSNTQQTLCVLQK